MKNITIRLSVDYVESIDQLVSAGLYSNRSEFIRKAVEKFITNSLVEEG